ncbi:MAG TPA: flagellar biosynthesis protein FlhF, partial [Pirellulales bacterium]|nr:flagellar biosynthesis protein FlhF [Pirellulales bacterium]
DLILLDTAGRSPTDDVKLQELTALVEEARPDEVHLTLSSTASASVLMRTAERFAAVGTTALILTKLDEAAGLGHLLPLLRESGLPLSYVTHGQNVPDDIGPADGGRLARQIVGLMS